MSEKRIELGNVYSVKVGGAFVAARADRSLGHGRYEGATVRPDGTGAPVKFATDAVRGEGMPEAEWRAKHAPQTNDLPVPEASTAAHAGPSAKRTARGGQPPKDRKPSGLDGAVRVLREAGTPMLCTDVVKKAIEKGYWQTGGKTPAATVYAAIIREIAAKGAESRFRKTARGTFELTDAGKAAA